MPAMHQNGHTSGAGGWHRGTLPNPPRHARCQRAAVAAPGVAGFRPGVSSCTQRARVPLLVSAFGASEREFRKAPSLTKAERSFQKAVQKNMNQLMHKFKIESSLEKPTLLQATIQDNKENFAGGFSGLASLYTAEALEEGKARRAIEIVTAAIDKSRVKVSRTHSGGSFGRRTLVNNAFDVDLIVYVKSYDGRDMTDPDVWRYDTDLVTAMRWHVKEALEATNPAWDVEIPSDAHYCDVLQVEVLGTHVDLLLVPDCVRGKPVDPVWYQHDVLTAEVYGNPAGAEYDQIRERADAAAFTRFVDTVHDDVKSVVRYVKALYKYGVLGDKGGLKGGGSWWPPEDDRIRSVSLEMLVLAADQQLRQRAYGGGQPARGDVYKLDLFLEVLELVVAAVRYKKVVTVSAGEWGYPGEAQDFAHCWEDDAIRIIHPIDPTCNLERPREHRGASNWRPLVVLAESILKLVHGGSTFQDLCAVPAVRRAMADVDIKRVPMLLTLQLARII